MATEQEFPDKQCGNLRRDVVCVAPSNSDCFLDKRAATAEKSCEILLSPTWLLRPVMIGIEIKITAENTDSL